MIPSRSLLLSTIDCGVAGCCITVKIQYCNMSCRHFMPNNTHAHTQRKHTFSKICTPLLWILEISVGNFLACVRVLLNRAPPFRRTLQYNELFIIISKLRYLYFWPLTLIMLDVFFPNMSRTCRILAIVFLLLLLQGLIAAGLTLVMIGVQGSVSIFFIIGDKTYEHRYIFFLRKQLEFCSFVISILSAFQNGRPIAPSQMAHASPTLKLSTQSRRNFAINIVAGSSGEPIKWQTWALRWTTTARVRFGSSLWITGDVSSIFTFFCVWQLCVPWKFPLMASHKEPMA